MTKPIGHFDERLQLLIETALAEDIGEGDNYTMAVIPAYASGKAILHIKQSGILAGVEIAEKILRYREPGILFELHKKDGELMQCGETAFTIEANIHTI